MKSAKVAILLVLFNALLSLSTAASDAAQAKHSPGQRGGQADAHKNSKGSAQGKHQWVADPERGWVRRDETRGAKDQSSATKRRDQPRGPSNNKGKRF